MRKRVLIEKPGSYERLKIVEDAIPQPQSGEVLIEVEAIGVNYADCLIRMGLYSSAKHYVGWPITPGFEVAGKIASLGAGVEGWRLHDPVIAVTRFGGYTSHLCVPASQIVRQPDALDAPAAASLPTVFLTAWYALFCLASPRPKQRVLIHSAAGGVGSCLIQLSRIAECEVTAVVGASHKVEIARKLGAHHTIDASTQDLWKTAHALAPAGYHMIFDANGAESLRHSYHHLAAPGKLIIYGFHTMLPKQGGRPNWLKLLWRYLRTPRFNPLHLTQMNRSILALNLSYMFEEQALLHEGMTTILDWLNEGKLQPPPLKTYPLHQVAQAHRDLESAQTVGKLILVP